MKTVKAAPVEAASGSVWFYGSDYMVKVSPAEARALCAPYPPPGMGLETVVAVQKGGIRELVVQNISGMFVLASSHTKRADWPEVYGVTAELVGGL